MNTIIAINTRYHFKSVPSQACLGRSIGGGFGLHYVRGLHFHKPALHKWRIETCHGPSSSPSTSPSASRASTDSFSGPLRPIVHSNHGSEIVVIPRDKW